jgi:4a-hydroxytetrahydrobiopterin dehydratase
MKPESLDSKEVQSRLAKLEGWSLNAKGEIQKTFVWKDFSHAVLFVNAVGHLAETADHHPDVLIQWNKVTLSLVTHDSEGLTRRDFALAERVELLTKKYSQS